MLVTSNLHKGQGGFSKSKATLGTIGPLSRCRVSELLRDDAETPPNPQQRVSCLPKCIEAVNFTIMGSYANSIHIQGCPARGDCNAGAVGILD